MDLIDTVADLNALHFFVNKIGLNYFVQISTWNSVKYISVKIDRIEANKMPVCVVHDPRVKLMDGN